MTTSGPTLRHQVLPLFGILLLCLAGLAYEVLLTRLLSVTLFHHFAFLAVSVALLGVGGGGALAYLFADRLQRQALSGQLGWSALGFALSAPLGFFIQQQIPLTTAWSVSGLIWLALKFGLLAVPFLFLGMVMALAFSRLPLPAGRVYAADLVGAALGCLVAVLLLDWLGGVNALIACALIAGLAGLVFFQTHPGAATGRQVAWLLVLLLAMAITGNAQYRLLSVQPLNRAGADESITERWNAFSRLGVYAIENPRAILSTVSRRFRGEIPAALHLQIDSSASSYILQPPSAGQAAHDYLFYDIAFLAFQLFDYPQRIMVIGPGGGRDLWAATATGAEQVVAVEVNPDIVDLVEEELADFSGRPYHLPGVRTVIDEARSYLARDPSRYDLIHSTLACTWSAGGASAFALTENGLYTLEAFRSYLAHLSPEGIMSMTMWYRGTPAELLRLAHTARIALAELGVANPADHIIVVGRDFKAKPGVAPAGFGNLLFSATPFTRQQIERVTGLTRMLDFRNFHLPGGEAEAEFVELLESADPNAAVQGFPLDIGVSTDDRPFFFYLLRHLDVLRALLPEHALSGSQVEDAMQSGVVVILWGLLLTALVFVGLLILLPLWVKRSAVARQRRTWVSAGYFFGIGTGFILVEIALLHRLGLFLGKPVLALSVTLGVLLVSGGVGSWLSRRWVGKSPAGLFGLITILIAGYAFWMPDWLNATEGLGDVARIGVAILILMPLGLVMGMPLPIAVEWLKSQSSDLIHWSWGINGAASVLGSILAMIIAMNFGIRTTLLAGLLFYVLAAAFSALLFRRDAG